LGRHFFLKDGIHNRMFSIEPIVGGSLSENVSRRRLFERMLCLVGDNFGLREIDHFEWGEADKPEDYENAELISDADIRLSGA